MVEPRFRISVGRRFDLGPGKVALLEQIKKTGSIAEAAKAMEMSYMRAWMLVKSMNGNVANPLIMTVRGGRKHGGAKLTETGCLVLKLYRQMEGQSLVATRPIQLKLARVLNS